MWDKFFGAILKPRRTGVAWATGVALLVAFGVVAANHAEGRRLAELLGSARPGRLDAAAALQVATYVCAAAVWQRALRRNGGVRRSVRSLVPLGLVKLFADQALPSAGLSWTLLVVRGLLRRGVPRGLAITAMLADLVSWYAAYALVGAAALAILWHRGELNRVLVAIGVAFLLLATGVPLTILGLRDREPSLPRWLQRLPWATLLARGFTFWLPMAPGLAIARREIMRETASAGPTAVAETP